LRSGLDPDACLANLEQVLLGYRPPKYAHMPSYFVPGWRWNDEATPAPAQAVVCDDSNDDFVLVALWPAASGTELGLFPLGSGDDRLQALPLIGHWKQRDPSLTSIGVVPGGSVTLRPPRLPDDFLHGLLVGGGRPATERNLELAAHKMNEQFVIKAFQFIGSKDQRAADRFIDAHAWRPGSGIAGLQAVLDDLAAPFPVVLPYMQDLPMRARAILLEYVDSGNSFWESLDR
jgi:hypothetical protein